MTDCMSVATYSPISVANCPNSSNQALSMSSREISELVGIRHDNVKRTIERLANKGTITFPQMEEKPTDGRPASEYLFTGDTGKRDSIIVVAQLSPEFTARLVDRWQELENRTRTNTIALPNFSDPAAAARAWAKQYEQKQLIQVERDEAIRTKAEIGSRREATAMATASKAMRLAGKLSEQLGHNAKHATVIAVEHALGRKLGSQDWRPLRAYCKSNALEATTVTDPRWGEVKAWPAAAWEAVFNIDLTALFPEKGMMQ